MQSISKGEFEVINFLVRNFSQRFTMRNIALTLKLSPAGVHSLLKKLEKNNIVVSEKLGTGLFYDLNFKNKIAHHLASIVLLEGQTKDVDISKIEAKSILLTQKDVLIITDSVSVSDISVEDFSTIVLTEDEFIEKIRSKDAKTLQIIRDCRVAKGENELVSLIKRGIYR